MHEYKNILYARFKERKDSVVLVLNSAYTFTFRFRKQLLTVCLSWVGSDLDEVDGSILVVFVMLFRRSSRAGARLLDQECCGHNYQDNR